MPLNNNNVTNICLAYLDYSKNLNILINLCKNENGRIGLGSDSFISMLSDDGQIYNKY